MCADLLGAPLPDPRHVRIDANHNNISLRRAAQRAADKLGMRVEEIWPRVSALGGALGTNSLRLMAMGLRRFFTATMHSIKVYGDLETVRQAAGPVVLLPTHRSHIDYLILSYAAYLLDLQMPMIAAGENLNMPIVGNFLARCGAFFIKRSFKDDTVYKAVFKEWMEELMVNEQTVEFFPEGGRSRTGRIAPIKMGMLKVYCDAVRNRSIENVTFIPVDISYDFPFEMELDGYISQRLGKPKEKESILGLLNTILKGNFSAKKNNVYITYGKPFTYVDILNNNLQNFDELQIISKIISQQFASLFKICAYHIVCACVQFKRRIHNSSFDIAEISSQVMKFLSDKESLYRAQCCFEISDEVQELLNKSCEVESFDGDLDHFNSLRIGYFRNQISSILCIDSIICIVIQSINRFEGEVDVLEEAAFFLDLLKVEFPCIEDCMIQKKFDALVKCQILTEFYEVKNESVFKFLISLTKPVLETYLVVVELLITSENACKSEDQMLIEYPNFARNILKEIPSFSSEILCMQTALNAFQSVKRSCYDKQSLEILASQIYCCVHSSTSFTYPHDGILSVD